jgi:hypothetical protein
MLYLVFGSCWQVNNGHKLMEAFRRFFAGSSDHIMACMPNHFCYLKHHLNYERIGSYIATGNEGDPCFTLNNKA